MSFENNFEQTWRKKIAVEIISFKRATHILAHLFNLIKFFKLNIMYLSILVKFFNKLSNFDHMM